MVPGINSEDYYWAGFLAADGCVDNKNRVRLGLNIADVLHLEKFKKYTKSGNKVSVCEKYNRCTFEFTDKIYRELLEDIFKITPKKSLTYSPPVEALTPDFIRGYFDGDGCICESFSNAHSKTATLYTTVTGSTNCVHSIHAVLCGALGVSGFLANRHKYAKNEYYCAKYSSTPSFKILPYLYSNSLPDTRLDRKYALYEKIVINGIRKTR